MKPTLLNLSIIFFAFTTYFPLAFTQDGEEVKDINGNLIFPGGRYYIKPAIFGAPGGGVKLGTTQNSTCPVSVLQDYSEVISGKPVKFTIQGTSTGIILTWNTQLDIAFEEKAPECAESSKWVVVIGNFSSDGYVGSIGIGGLKNHQGKQIRNGSFSIEKSGLGYKFVFCPKYNPPQPAVCLDVGRFDQENGRLLIVSTRTPFEVVFVDADATDQSSI